MFFSFTTLSNNEYYEKIDASAYWEALEKKNFEAIIKEPDLFKIAFLLAAEKLSHIPHRQLLNKKLQYITVRFAGGISQWQKFRADVETIHSIFVKTLKSCSPFTLQFSAREDGSYATFYQIEHETRKVCLLMDSREQQEVLPTLAATYDISCTPRDIVSDLPMKDGLSPFLKVLEFKWGCSYFSLTQLMQPLAPLPELGAFAYALSQQGSLCDWTLISSDKQFRIHSLLFSLEAEFFSKLFDSSMKESREKTVVLPYSSEVVESLIKFVYLGPSSVQLHLQESGPDLQCLAELYSLADYLQMARFKTFCFNMLCLFITSADREEIQSLASQYPFDGNLSLLAQKLQSLHSSQSKD